MCIVFTSVHATTGLYSKLHTICYCQLLPCEKQAALHVWFGRFLHSMPFPDAIPRGFLSLLESFIDLSLHRWIYKRLCYGAALYVLYHTFCYFNYYCVLFRYLDVCYFDALAILFLKKVIKINRFLMLLWPFMLYIHSTAWWFTQFPHKWKIPV